MKIKPNTLSWTEAHFSAVYSETRTKVKARGKSKDTWPKERKIKRLGQKKNSSFKPSGVKKLVRYERQYTEVLLHSIQPRIDFFSKKTNKHLLYIVTFSF